MSENRPAIEKRLRWIAIASLLVFPLLTLWNLYAFSHHPKLRVMIGQLHGVTEPQQSVQLNAHNFTGGSWQKFATAIVSEAYPLRPILIQLNNQIRFKLFGAYAAPDVLMGEKGQLIEKSYLLEYCARNTAKLRESASAWIPKLKELQDFYEARGHVFIYLLTPSKVAYMPENFVHRVSCPANEHDRREKLAIYDKLLADGGVHFVDAATLTHNMKGKYKIDLFPQGGVHWNGIGIANAANAILAEINFLEKRDVAPKLAWRYEVTNTAKGTDRDLADLINVLRPNVHYATANVMYEPTVCANFAVSSQKVAFVGGSFIAGLAGILAGNGCLSEMNGYNYLYRGWHAGPAYKLVKRRPTTQDILPLRDADIVILEENESLAPGAAHAREFYRVMLGK